MKKRNRIFLYAGLAIVVLAAICLPRWIGGTSPEETREKETAGSPPPVSLAGNATPVGIYVINPTYLASGIYVNGFLVPREEVEITTEVAGKITSIFFTEGSTVRKGDLLVKMNDEDLQAQLVRAEFQEKLLAEKLERQKILLTKEAISREAYDQLETDHNMVVADITLLKVRIDKTEIRAPFNGVIGFRYVSDGSYVQPGTKVARLVDNSTMIVEFSLSNRYIAMPLVGKNIIFRVEGFPQDFHAQVYAVEPKLDENTRTILLRARYNNSSGLLLAGTPADVTLITKESDNAIQVPTETIVPDVSGVSVWLVRNGRAVSTPIETGIRSEQMIEVLSGLSVSDTVITTGIMQLRPNTPVRILP
jgi:membrane fusion protein (multidrug efflux system)